MPESDSEIEDRNPRFTGALFGRILAVGLFLVLGTFAVIHLMGEKKPELDPDAQAQLDPNSTDGNAKVDQTAGLLNAQTGQPKPTINNSSFLNQKSAPSSPPKKTNSLNNNSFGSNPTTPPGQSPLSRYASQQKTPGSNLKVTASKPTTGTKPPPRYAQLPNSGPPIIGNNNGFATSAPKAGSITDPLKQAANNARGTVNQLGNNLTKGANNALNTVKQKTSSTINGIQNKASSLAQQSPFGSGSSLTTGSSNPRIQIPGATTKAPGVVPSNTKPLGSNSFASSKAPSVNLNSGGSQNPFGSGSSTTVPPIRSSSSPRIAPPLRGNSPNSTLSGNLSPIKSGQSTSSSSPFGSGSSLNSSTRQSSTAPPRSPIRQNFGGPSTSQVNANTRSKSSGSPQGFGGRQNFSPVSTSAPSKSSGFPPSNISRTTTLSAPATGITKNVPGDRQLEGVQAPALTVEKLSPREIQVNQPAEFQIVVRNVGRVAANDVVVYDQVPARTEFQGASPDPNSRAGDRQLNWKIGDLRPGQEKRIKLRLKPTSPGEIGSVAHVTFATKASMRTLVTKPVLEITHRTKPKVLVGDDVIFDVVVTNKGDGAAKDVVIQEDVPKQLEYLDGYRELEYDIGTLMPGQSKRVQLGLKAAQIGRLRNVMQVAASGGLKSNHALDMEVIAPSLVASSNGPTKRFLQREVTHQFGVVNKGTAAATNVDLIAKMPPGLRFVRANNQGRYDAGSHSVLWSLAELGLDVDAKVELVSVPVEAGNQDIKFEAVADLNQKSQAIQKLNVEHLVDVFFDIDDVVDPIEIGSGTSYRIKVVNQGTKSATNVQLQVEFPNGIAPTSVDGNIENQIQGQRIAFAPITNMNPGDQLQFVINAKGQAAGDHRIVVNMRTDGRQTQVSKEETTRVYADR